MNPLIPDKRWASVLRRRLIAPVAIALATMVVAGCKVDFDKMRREHVATLQEDMSARMSKALAEGEPLGLEDCVRIALANNLDIKAAHINRRLAGLDRKIAFSNFLPRIDVDVSYATADRHQSHRVGSGYAAMSDRTAARGAVRAQQTIFAPETWFLYEAFKKGEGISKLIARRTRDLIRLQITSLYFASLSQDKSGRVIEYSLEQARVILNELEALRREGLVMPSQVEQIRTLVMATEANLAANHRLQRETKSDLLEAMGLSPMGEITLRADTPLVVKEQELAEHILQAMLQRPELHIADRTIEIRKDETRMAIAQFLPKIVGIGSLAHSSDSFLKYSNTLTVGISGVLTVFDGFANVFGYKAAKEREKQATISREQSCMKIMLEVIRARSQFDWSRDMLAVTQQELAASRSTLDETEARWREGLLITSERLDAVTRHATAQANASIAEFRYQVSAATLLDVIGTSTKGNGREQVN